MAGWVSALRALPWRDVLAAAPTIVKGAKVLWASVRTTDNVLPGEASQHGGVQNAVDVPRVESRLTVLEARVQEMSDEAVASAEIVRSLAEQNAKLVEAVNVLRLRTRILLWAITALALVTTLVAIIALAR